METNAQGSGRYMLNEQGEPVECPDLLTWGKWFEKADRKVAVDTLPGGVRVSTVFLGLDHSFGDGPPLIYETMVFGGDIDGDQDRYSTREQALAGHAEMVARCRAALA